MSYKGTKLSQKSKDKIRKSHIGLKHTNETKQKMRLNRQNNQKYNSNHLRGKKYPHSAWNKGKSNFSAVGEKNPNWKGGITLKIDKLRKSIEWKNWRLKVFERDNWTCQNCGLKKSGYLHPHHIKEREVYPELMFDIDNGITLCDICHMSLHKIFILKENRVPVNQFVAR